MTPPEITDAIRYLRLVGMAVNDIARSAGVSRRTVYRVLANRPAPTRCPGCGRVVSGPCIVCHARQWAADRIAVGYQESAELAGDDALAIALEGEEADRYRCLRRLREMAFAAAMENSER